MLERFMAFLQIPKQSILANYKDKLGTYEKQIVNVINSNRRKPGAPQQQGQALPPQHMQSQQSHDNQMSSQMQTGNMQGSMGGMQQNNMGSMQQNSVSSLQGSSNPQQNMMNSMQPSSNLDQVQNSSMNSLQQVSGGSLQQNAVSGAQQVNINPMASHSGMGTLQPNSNMLQHQHIKQQEQLLQSQQLKQFQQRQMQQQYVHKQQLMQQQQQQQQQQFHQQAKQQQQGGQLQGNQLAQLHQINDGGDIKLRQQMNMKAGAFQQQQATAAQRSAYHQQLKSGAPFSPQLLSAASPQMSQHASPQIDQQSMFNSHTKSGPGEFERISGVSSLSNVGNIGHQANAAVIPSQSLAIGTPGMSASPLLAEFISPDGINNVGPSIGSGRSSVTEQPLERLLKAVKTISPAALSASVSDIGSVVRSAPGNGSRAAVGEDLVAMTKCRLQARTLVTQDGTNGVRKMKRFTSAMPLNVVSSAGSVNDSFKQLSVDTSELDSTASSAIKRPRVESPIQPLRLLVPANYPNCSPILLDKFPAEVRTEVAPSAQNMVHGRTA
nr:hypothetical protein [Tanacetum cinerariifolium]